ncbi:MAG: hypothetical protein IKA76_06950 [Clostridia bacterium]|nr:hypothetical protein [Clostridia bacterium]
MAAGRSNVTRILISIIFIVLGVNSVFDAFEALLELDLAGILGSALGVLMFVTGLFGLFRTKVKVCRVLGIFICVLSALNFAMALSNGLFDVSSLVQALLAWIYYDCT